MFHLFWCVFLFSYQNRTLSLSLSVDIYILILTYLYIFAWLCEVETGVTTKVCPPKRNGAGAVAHGVGGVSGTQLFDCGSTKSG